ncbi:MAG: cold-shock protein [Chloroflexus sp.]|uniref:cold-shock protein n=1 Tax=Chloroflexus sp. TaxID=1904827 RepID=UPI0040490C37
MDTTFKQGTLSVWYDEQGDGFIVDPNGERTFVHVTTFGRIPRRPVVGDTIFYTTAIDRDGKIYADYAWIEGLPAPRRRSHFRQHRKKSRPWGLTDVVLLLTVILLFLIAGWLLTATFAGDTITTTVTQTSAKRPGPPECVIKGNISIDTGEKIYHLPGMKDYEITRISEEHGERWFCTEQEAIQAGWRRAGR